MLLVGNKVDLAGWLQAELDRRGWSQAELARRSGLSRGMISKLLAEGPHSQPQPQTLRALAKGLDLKPALVFQAAGELPPNPDADPWVEEKAYKLSRLDPQLREIADDFIDGLVRRQERNKDNERSRRGKTKPARP